MSAWIAFAAAMSEPPPVLSPFLSLATPASRDLAVNRCFFRAKSQAMIALPYGRLREAFGLPV